MKVTLFALHVMIFVALSSFGCYDAINLVESGGSNCTPGDGSGDVFIPYDEPPQPVGGFAEIQRNAHYTEEARSNGIEGRVILQVLICRDGSVVDTRVIKSLGFGLDEAANFAVNQVSWIPAMQRTNPVTVWIAIPVVFRLG